MKHIARLLAALLAFSGLLSSAFAGDFTVTTTEDRNSGACLVGDCSLREAVIAANTDISGTNTITLPAGELI